MYSDKENINILTSLMVAYGVKHVVVCPGSRNAPLVHNFTVCPDLVCHPVTDERSAAFVALGIATQTHGVVAVCVTSGTALLNTLPAVAEAKYQQRRLLVISADRPQAWIDRLDGQTLPQPGVLQPFAAESVTLPECKDSEERWHCRSLVCQAFIAMQRDSAPAHINVPLSEPLFGFNTPTLPSVRPVAFSDFSQGRLEASLAATIAKAKRPMVVIGQCDEGDIENDLLERLSHRYVVLAEQLSCDAPSPALDTLFALMDSSGDTAIYRPDLVVYCGGNTISKRLRLFLRKQEQADVLLVNNDGALHDPTTHATAVVRGDTTAVLAALADDCSGAETSSFLDDWRRLLDETRQTLDNTVPQRLDERAVQAFEHLMPLGSTVFYANSSSVRWAARHARHYVCCNRGVNGIEGSLSTAVGASLVTDGKVFCVIGDLSFFYDQNALWNNHLGGNLRILLLNNGGGLIFTSLPGLAASPAANSHVMATHRTTAEGACAQHGVVYRNITDTDNLDEAIAWLTLSQSERPMLLEVLASIE